jgi:hypothetical protein
MPTWTPFGMERVISFAPKEASIRSEWSRESEGSITVVGPSA